jgi:hypothetical protein
MHGLAVKKRRHCCKKLIEGNKHDALSGIHTWLEPGVNSNIFDDRH